MSGPAGIGVLEGMVNQQDSQLELALEFARIAETFLLEEGGPDQTHSPLTISANARIASGKLSCNPVLNAFTPASSAALPR